MKGGKVGALRELTQDELSAYLNDSAVQKSRSNRFDSSYLLCKEKDGSTIVVWYESEADIAEKTKLCALLGIKNGYLMRDIPLFCCVQKLSFQESKCGGSFTCGAVASW